MSHNPVNNDCLSNKENKKRKRLKNTTSEQYEMYLEAIENDYAFRSNTINPTMDQNYIHKKWEELVEKLNAVGQGPALSIEEWKKRFADWRYGTKAKYRKISQHRIQTGGGPVLEVILTPLEERALSAWGMVTVTGNEHVTTYEGIPVTAGNVTNNENEIFYEEEPEQEDIPTETVIINVENVTPSTTTTHKRVRPKPLSELAESLINVTKTNTSLTENFCKHIKEFTDAFINLEKENIEIRKQQLDFEVKKFKFLHPDFPL